MTEETPTPPKRRPGRPTLPDSERKGGSNLTFRARGGLREQLVQAAESSGRSISEEIEHRLTMSFEWERAFGSAKTLLEDANGATARDLTARHHQAGHVQVSTSAGKIWAEPGALDALTAPSIERSVKSAVVEALAEAGLTGKKAE